MALPLQSTPFSARSTPRDLAAVVLILLFGFALRVFDLDHTPHFVHWDEVNEAKQIANILSGEVPLLGTGYNDNPNLTFFEHAPYLLFGADLWALRITSALWSVLTLAVVYFAVRVVFGTRTALFSALLMAGAHLLVQYGRVGVNVLPAVLTSFLALGLLARAQRETSLGPRSQLLYACAGMAAALNLYAYVAARAALIAVAALWLCDWPRQRAAWRAYARHALIFGASMSVIAMPIAWWYVQHPEALTSRAETLSVFGAWAAHINVERYGEVDTARLLSLQALDSIGGFVAAWDTSPNYGIHAALVDAGTTMLLVPGMVLAWRRARRAAIALLCTVAGSLLAGAVLIVEPPSSPHYIVLVPVMLTLAAVCLDWLAATPRSWNFVPLILTGIVALNVYLYFGYYPSHGAWLSRESDVGYFARDLNGCCALLYLGEPAESARQITDFIAAPDAIVYSGDENELALEANSQLARQRPVVIIIPKDHVEALQHLHQLLPEGFEQSYLDRGEVLFHLYWLNKATD